MNIKKIPTPDPDEEFAKSLERSRSELKRQAKRTRITPAELQATLSDVLSRIASEGEGFVIVGDDGEPLAQMLPPEPNPKNAPLALQEIMDALREDYYQANPDGDFADHLAEARAMFRQDG